MTTAKQTQDNGTAPPAVGSRLDRRVRCLPVAEPRVETGPLQFGDDWPGTFIRGDASFGYVADLDAAIEALERIARETTGGRLHWIALGLVSLRDTLAESDMTGLSCKAPNVAVNSTAEAREGP